MGKALFKNSLILLRLLRISQSHVIKDERVNISLFFQDLGNRLATSVTCLGVDADNLGLVAGLGCLQGGCILERVGGHHAVVVVGSGDHDGGIVYVGTALDGVQRRVGI